MRRPTQSIDRAVAVALAFGFVARSWRCVCADDRTDAPPTLPYHAADKSMGVVNCANSLCHGSVQPIKDSNVLQTEYVTWSRVDKHARSYRALFNEQSQRIARNLGLAKPPSEEKLCLDCHAHNVPVALRGERFRFRRRRVRGLPRPAGRWLESQCRTARRMPTTWRAGMYPTDDPVARARTVPVVPFRQRRTLGHAPDHGRGTSAHGVRARHVHRCRAPHYKLDANWNKRKGTWDGVQGLGDRPGARRGRDAGRAARSEARTRRPVPRARAVRLPRLPSSDERASAGRRASPASGRAAVRLNDSSMLMVRQIAHVVDPPLGTRIAATMTRLQQTVSGGRRRARAGARQ